jgi:hypothetical protein
MFMLDGYTITLSRGDTGAIKIIADTDYEFASTDRALFSIKSANGEGVKQQAFALDENNAFVVTFNNSDTDSLPPSACSWDVRYVINPYYDSNGNIVDGDQVITPRQPMTMNILQVVGEV